MQQDFSWDSSAQKYITMYERSLSKHQPSGKKD